jgi:hypothetical protein
MLAETRVICPWCLESRTEVREIEDIKDILSCKIYEKCKKKARTKVKWKERKEERKTKEEKDWDDFVLSRY